jgi:hypothetical protein
VKAATTTLDYPLTHAEDATGRTPPWAWRLTAMVAGMVAAALVGRAIKAGQGRMRSRSTLVRWSAALALTAVAGVAAAKSRTLAQGAVTRAWNRRSA